MPTTDQSTQPPANDNARAVIPIGPKGVELRDVDAMFRFARCYLQSGLTPPSFKNEQQLVICWAKAAELGLSPLQAVEGMSVINNRVGIMGDLALAMVESSGLLEQKRVEYTGEDDSLECKVTLQRKGRETQTYSFSVQEAKAANIYDRSPVWRNYPKRMTYYRALGFGLRDEFSDVLKGTKTVEELMDYPAEEPPKSRRVRVVQSAEKSEPPPSEPDVEPDPPPDPSPVQNGRNALRNIKLRLAASHITESEFINVLRFSRLPEAEDITALDQVPEGLLEKALSGWSTVAELAYELRSRQAEAKP
jgi:hypothetical protein